MSVTMTFERAVLEVLAAAPEPFGWYNIEVRLSNMAVSERLHLPTVLGAFIERGWVAVSKGEATPLVRYVLTEAGRVALNSAHGAGG